MTSAGFIPSDPARRIERLLSEYGDGHRNLVNRAIHALTVPVIFWAALALVSRLPIPDGWRMVPGLDWALIVVIAATLYYTTLSVPIAIGMGVFQVLCLLATAAFVRWGEIPVWQLALFLAAIAWALQLIGHKLEGRRASLVRDLQLLLIGPAWLLAGLYRLVGARY